MSDNDRNHTIQDEKKFICNLGHQSDYGHAVGKAAALEGYIKALDLPQDTWTEEEIAELRRFAEMQRMGE